MERKSLRQACSDQRKKRPIILKTSVLSVCLPYVNPPVLLFATLTVGKNKRNKFYLSISNHYCFKNSSFARCTRVA